MATTYAKLPLKQWGRNVYQMVIKDINFFNSKGFQNVPNVGVWFENKLSGNPDTYHQKYACL
jgi:hypothetical protein